MPRANRTGERVHGPPRGGGYLAAASSAFFRSSMISFWMFPGVGRYFENSIVKTPCPCVMLRRSVE